MSAHKIQAPVNLPKERIQHTEISNPCNLENGICVPLRLQFFIEANYDFVYNGLYLQFLLLTLHTPLFHVLKCKVIPLQAWCGPWVEV